MDKQILLQRVPAFSRLTGEQLAVLATSVGIQQFDRGEPIFHHGSIGSVLYMIVVGQVRIYRVTPSGQEVAITVFCDGDFFGELALLDGLPRAASAVAMMTTTTLTLHRAAFLHTLNTCPPIAASILEVMAARLRENGDRAEQMASVPATQRVARQLLDLAGRVALRYGDGALPLQIELALTQDDLASLSGTTRETVNRVLSGLRDQGLVKVERARISILNLRLLQAALDGPEPARVAMREHGGL
jgi:CRP/FNR family transcriptional regulator, cyclic AMP receptor protein